MLFETIIKFLRKVQLSWKSKKESPVIRFLSAVKVAQKLPSVKAELFSCFNGKGVKISSCDNIEFFPWKAVCEWAKVIEHIEKEMRIFSRNRQKFRSMIGL